MMVFALMNDGRIVNLHELMATVEIRHRDEQVESLPGRKQGRSALARRPHSEHRVIHQFCHLHSVEGRLEPARSHEKRELGAHLWIAHEPQAREPGRPEKWPKKPLAPAAGLCFGSEQYGDVGILEPEVAQAAHRQIMTESPRQHGAVDSPGRGACHDVYDNPQFERLANVAQQVKINCLGIVFGIGSIVPVEEAGRCPLSPVGNGVKRTGRPRQLQKFLGDAVHIDCERHAAKADECDAEFFLVQCRCPERCPELTQQ